MWFSFDENITSFQVEPRCSSVNRIDVPERLQVRPIPLVLVVIFVVAYVLPGLIGHDPWKADEGYTFGNIYDLLQTGDWIVPHLAGEPFLEKPPLYHLVAAGLAILTKPWLQLHDGARLASALFMGVTLLAVGWSARHSLGERCGRIGVLMALSTVGLLIHAHMMLTDLALMAGFSIAMAGLVACSLGIRFGGLLLGTGMGMAFLAKGLIGPCAISIASTLLPIMFANWRSKAYLKQLGYAALALSPWLTIWPVALYLRSRDLFSIWLWDNNFGRFFGFSVHQLGASHEAGFWWRTYPWFLFPLWLFVLPQFFYLRRVVWEKPAVQIGTMLTATMAIVLGLSASAREIYALPLIVPLSLIATAGVAYAPPKVDQALRALGLLIVSCSLIFFWVGWVALHNTGAVPEWCWLVHWLPQNFAMPVSVVQLLTAGFLSFGSLAIGIFCWRKQNDGLLLWSVSLGLGWGLAMTLWLPWIDYAKSYRSMFMSIPIVADTSGNCVSSRGLGESERAMLEYTLSIVTKRVEILPNANCAALLIQSSVSKTIRPDLASWHLVWSGNRPGDIRERFDLYARNPNRIYSMNHQAVR